jgi:hypothetical protein
MSKLDRILELVEDMTQDETEQLVSELFQILDEDHFENLRIKFFVDPISDSDAPSS